MDARTGDVNWRRRDSGLHTVPEGTNPPPPADALAGTLSVLVVALVQAGALAALPGVALLG